MKPVQWSFSSLKDFIGCPRRYYEVKVCNNFEQKITHALTYGKEVHTALELYVRDGVELPPNYKRFKKAVDELSKIPGEKYCEHEMALLPDLTPCDFHDTNRWVRGIADLLIVDGDTAYVVDYKTGKANYPDVDQLKLMALMVFAHFPEVQKVKGALLFILKNHLVGEDYTRDQSEELWKEFHQKVEKLRISIEKNEWTPNPTPLCGYCPVSTCEFNRC
jgi:CRISPR/Cas system-associated exonuclease Cas4 (RecB family)